MHLMYICYNSYLNFLGTLLLGGSKLGEAYFQGWKCEGNVLQKTTGVLWLALSFSCTGCA